VWQIVPVEENTPRGVEIAQIDLATAKTLFRTSASISFPHDADQ
jgi:hypothetical protein